MQNKNNTRNIYYFLEMDGKEAKNNLFWQVWVKNLFDQEIMTGSQFRDRTPFLWLTSHVTLTKVI